MTCQIVYHNGNCLNTKKPFARACRLCIEGCPHQAISEYRQLDAKLCTECGACMAVCPSDGFVDQTMHQLHDYLLGAKEIVLNCPQAIPRGFEIPCLGILDRDGWITLMLLAREKSVTIMTGVCAECEDRQACAASVQVFKQVHLDWPDHASVRIQVRPEEETVVSETEDGSKSVVRRVEMTGWRQRSMKKIEEWLPNLTADETYPMSRSRQWLLGVLEKTLEEKIPFRALTVADTCTSCGVCAAICPQGALQKREEMNPVIEDADKEEKIMSLRLILEPQKCVHCGRCVEICRPLALSFSTKQLSYRLLTGKILLHEGSPKYCSRCGKRIFDNSELCLVCSTSDPGSGSSFFL
ncbi:4Fe-4S binding protein [Desulfosporosinus metallidurans]|uniref:Ferredoxin n=1 Tax=Desulfosporosinus metallidurans TaxID=1888891 RepID=A0A1Q8QS90_9FIRM|nr:4Fe-4S binding protein [Desulfosporosinus metallidurans]OLN30214.1 Ferredoxin [Desulfosporosinus metallidurans]